MADPKPWEMQWGAPAPMAPRGFVYTPPPDPTKIHADQRADNSDKRDDVRLHLAEQEAQRQAAKDAREAAKEKPPLDPALKQKLDDLQLNDVLYAVSRARDILHKGHATGVIGQLGKTFWGSSANDLQGAINTIGGNTLLNRLQALMEASATGASGLGQLSNREGEYLRDSIASIKPEMSSQAILDGLAQVERHTRALQAIQSGQNPDDPKIQKQFGIMATVPPASGNGPGGGNNGRQPFGGPPSGGNDPNDPTGGLGLMKGAPTTQAAADPALAGVNSHVRALIRAGQGKDVPAYLESIQKGLSSDPGVAGRLPEWIKFIDQHAGYKGPIGVNLETKQVPVGAVQRELNRLGTDTIGGPALLGAGDMLSGGTLDNMTSNPALTRAGLSQIQTDHPYSTLGGQVLGAAGMGAGIEAGAARLGAGGLAAAMAGDALPGMAYGAGSADDGNRVTGGLEGGMAGLVGGALGRGVGRVVQGAGNAAATRLSALGVPMTVPQILGGGWKALEDRASGWPITKGLISGARRQGIEEVNRVANRQTAGRVGETIGNDIGEGGMNDLHDAVTQGYQKALGGVQVQLDRPYLDAVGKLGPEVANIPEVGPTLHAALTRTVEPNVANGTISGDGFQAIDRGLQELRSAYSGNPQTKAIYHTHIAPAIDAVDDAITGIVQRQAPEVMPAYQSAKAAYRDYSTLSDAVNSAVNTDGVWMPSQLGTAARNNAKRFGGKQAAARGERPFFQLQRDAQQVLPSKIPDPGTAGQLMIPGALALAGGGLGGAKGYADDGKAGSAAEGAGAGTVIGLGTAAALASPYLARRALQPILTAPRNDVELLLGDYLKRARLPGSLAVPLLAGGQLEQ